MQPAEPAAPPAGSITMYTTPWCGYCVRLKGQLGRAGIPYQEVDIEAHPPAADFVMQVNGGNQSVPTVRFPDGTSVTNPSLRDVRARLAAAAGPSPTAGDPG